MGTRLPPSPAWRREALCVLCRSWRCGRGAGTGLNCPDLVCTMGEQLQTVCPEGDLSPSRREPLGDGLPHPPPVGGPQAAQTHIAQKGGGACQALPLSSFPLGTALLGYSA